MHAWLTALICLTLGLGHARAEAPVGVVVDGRFPVGQALVPIWSSAPLDRATPGATRAVIMVHGFTRVADRYSEYLTAALRRAGGSTESVVLIAPQFLTPVDVATHGLPAETARWGERDWASGAPALGPAPLSSFDVIDSIFARLADRALFPALRHVVLAGHAAGAQLTQRYAVVGKGESALTGRGIAVRYVVANPSSWLWFGAERPRPVDGCAEYDVWRYGFRDPPPYVTPAEDYERRYVARDVVYLLGELDHNPAHPALDKTCPAMAQGEHRLARGMLFMFNMEIRQPNQFYHRMFMIRNVGHDAARMFADRCGLAALFDRAGCVGLP
jgi:hypothetical protein